MDRNDAPPLRVLMEIPPPEEGEQTFTGVYFRLDDPPPRPLAPAGAVVDPWDPRVWYWRP
jgi:hypothetical protein